MGSMIFRPAHTRNGPSGALLILLLVILPRVLLQASGAQESPSAGDDRWQPARPISLIVPWPAGGAADRSARVTAGLLQERLGQQISVLNRPGAAGATGTREVFEAPRDGYTWAAGAAKELEIYRLQGMLEAGIDDWHLFLNVAIPWVLAVPADSPYGSFSELLTAFRDAPGEITVATAGTGSRSHIAMERIRRQTDIDYSHLAFTDGNAAVTAATAGKADAVLQLSVETADMLRSGKLRALTVLGAIPLELEGYGTVPPITDTIPGFRPAAVYYGIFIPRGVPWKVIESLGRIWDDVVRNSGDLRRFASENGLLFDPEWGPKARELTFPMIQLDAWHHYDSGQAAVSPGTAGIPRF
jgi:putative tricarboxylic transport membrane protein